MKYKILIYCLYPNLAWEKILKSRRSIVQFLQLSFGLREWKIYVFTLLINFTEKEGEIEVLN